MSAVFQRIIQGDVRSRLRELPQETVQCVVTSPPYYGLRDYGTAAWEGGDPACEHSCGTQVPDSKAPLAIRDGVRPGCDASKCRRCGALRVDSQIGLEQTPEAYVAALVEVFREVRRVLRPDGVLWLNLGDSFATGGGKAGASPGGGREGDRWKGYRGTRGESPKQSKGAMGPMTQPNRLRLPGLKKKDLIGIPWMVAFALPADGWYLRSDVIWHKPNHKPESVRDRPTRSHEYLFLLTKKERYFYDHEAVKEPARSGPSATRNRRSVWTVKTVPFKAAHFATFPPELIRPCILAGTPSGTPPATVLDPFAGAGTTLLVAQQLGRNSIGIDLSAEYCDLARRRLELPKG